LLEPPAERSADGEPVLLELAGISHTYGTFPALKEVTVRLQPGAIGLVGQNGAGKSTLLKILLGLIRPSQGTGRVLGQPLGKGRSNRRSRIGFMPEAESLVPGIRGVDLVALAGELSGMPRRQALRRAHEVLSYLELDEARYRRCEDYSVGMRQRLKLAAALVHDPQLLLLDEPTAGLDPAGRDAMLQLLQAIAARHGKSLILSTHLLGDIDRICGQVMILDRGTVLGCGPIATLRQVGARRVRLRWYGDSTEFVPSLQRAGIAFQDVRPGEAIVEVPAVWQNVAFFSLARESQVTLTDVVPLEEDVARLYHRLIGGGTRILSERERTKLKTEGA